VAEALVAIKSADKAIPVEGHRSLELSVRPHKSSEKQKEKENDLGDADKEVLKVRSIDKEHNLVAMQSSSSHSSKHKTHTHTVTHTDSNSRDHAATIEEGPVLSNYEKSMKRWKGMAGFVLESSPVVGSMAVMTIWALFSDDLRLALAAKWADTTFTVIISLGFFMFTAEILAASFCKDDYLYIPTQEILPGETVLSSYWRRIGVGSFYFWLDIIATLSLVFELPWTGVDISGGDSGDAPSKAGNASKAGARAGRIIRLVRMVRLVRLVKLYKYSAKIQEQKKKEKLKREKADERKAEGKPPIEDDGEETVVLAVGKESRVGAAMSDLMNRRVIVLVLIMLIVIPLLSTVDTNMEPELATEFIHNLFVSSVTGTTGLADYGAAKAKTIAFVVAEMAVIKLTMATNGVFDAASFTKTARIDELRTNEIDKFYSDSENGKYVTTLWIDKSSVTVAQSAMAIYTTLFVVICLVAGTFFFSADVNRLVIVPIERMVELVQKISANPLGVEYKMLGPEDGFIEGMETTTLLATITKIGRLMKVGFGEAGASVIAKNMSGEGGKLRLLGGGNMIHSIFGFCDVRQFTDTTECLQEEVMLFVNRIGHILHSIVVQCAGAANKNIGDAFLLTWKLEERWTAKETSAAADQALLCFCKALIELGRYEEFIVNFSITSTARLYKRFPGYHVRIGSGLHVGWAIEGAIGSHRKIDASYLSPHVNFTEFLESSTKAYGTPLLLSEPFFKLLSPSAAKFIRQVDRIRKSAQEEPMGLYTYDSDLSIDWADPNRKLISKRLMPTLRAITGKFKNVSRRASIGAAARMALTPEDIAAEAEAKRLKLETENALKQEDEKKYITPTIEMKEYHEDCWRGDPDLVDLRHRVNEKFRSTFHLGIEAYIAGDWRKAIETFEHTKKLSLNSGAADGPSQFLLGFMEETDGKPPPDWAGYRKEYGGGH